MGKICTGSSLCSKAMRFFKLILKCLQWLKSLNFGFYLHWHWWNHQGERGLFDKSGNSCNLPAEHWDDTFRWWVGFSFLMRFYTEEAPVPFSPPSSGSMSTHSNDMGAISLLCCCSYTRSPGRQGKPKHRETLCQHPGWHCDFIYSFSDHHSRILKKLQEHWQ